MPIIRLKLVTRDDSEPIAHETLQTLANELGEHFQTRQAETWVELNYLPSGQYAENLEEPGEDLTPTFVYVLQYQLPGQDQLAREARKLAHIVSNCLNRTEQNTHIIYEPEGKGRVAFGGVLVRADNKKDPP